MHSSEAAAVRAALGVLRTERWKREDCENWSHDEWKEVNASHALVVAWEVLADCNVDEPHFDCQVSGRGARVLRARLCLYIRALLRAERGYFDEIEHAGRAESHAITGRWYCYEASAEMWPNVCSECGERTFGWEDGDALPQRCPVTDTDGRVRLARPLWVFPDRGER